MIFDPLLAQRVGLRPLVVKYVWLTLVSLTTVAAFNVAGSVLIVALMIAPPASAFLLTKRLSVLLVLASLIAVASAVAGHYLAKTMDIAPTGPMASVAGAFFLLTFLFLPGRGFLASVAQQTSNRSHLRDQLVLELISNAPDLETATAKVEEVFGMSRTETLQAIEKLVASKLVTRDLELTEQGSASLPLQ